MGIDIIEGTLPPGWRGAYDHARRRITLVPGMSQREARCTLAHEVEHARRGDTPTVFGPLQARQEMIVDRAAAARLIDAHEYAQAEQLYGSDEQRLAYALNVTMRALQTWRGMVLAWPA